MFFSIWLISLLLLNDKQVHFEFIKWPILEFVLKLPLSFRANEKIFGGVQEREKVRFRVQKEKFVGVWLIAKQIVHLSLEWINADSDRHSCWVHKHASRMRKWSPSSCSLWPLFDTFIKPFYLIAKKRDVFCSASCSMACRIQHTLQTIEREADVIVEFL